MKKRAVAILMSLALAIGNMIPMPVYAAQEATEESTEEITVEEEAGGTEEKDESEEAEKADGQAEAVVSEEESASEGTDESESAADTDGEAVTEDDEEEEGETAEESAAEDEEGAVNGSSLADKTQLQEEEPVTEEIITDEEGIEAAADYIDEYTGPAQYKINMDGVDESGYIYADYLNIVNECIIQYGGTEELNGPSSGMKHFTGLSFLKLVDFNDDGVEELFLAFHVRTNAETDNYENHVYIYNIWGFDGQRAVLLQDGNYLYGTNGGTQKVYFVNNPFGTFFLHGVADSFCYNYYYGYEGSSFGLAKSLSWEEKYDASLKKMIKVYTVDGESTSQDHYNSELESWGSPSSADEEYSLTYTNSSDHDKVINTIDGTIDFLMQQCEKFSLDNAVVTLSGFAYNENGYDCFVYTGKQIKPDVVQVSLNGKNLSEGTDYTVEYGTNVNYGKGTVIVKGIGNFTGQKAIVFNIVPDKVSDLKPVLTACTYNTVHNIGVKHRALQLCWKKADSVSGYRVEYSDDPDFSSDAEILKTADVQTNSYTEEELERDKTLYVRVRAYAMVDGKMSYGAYSDTLTYKICNHLIGKDFWNIENDTVHRIDSSYFRELYTPAQADQMANNMNSNGGTGLCFGLSNLAISVLSKDYPPLSQFNVESLSEINSFDQDALAKDYIYYTYTMQGEAVYTNEYNDLDYFLSRVEDYTMRGGQPVDFMIGWVSDVKGELIGGHNLVALDIAEKTNREVKIRVYDCNYRNEEQFLYLYDDFNTGHYTRWSYDLYNGSATVTELSRGLNNDYIRTMLPGSNDKITAALADVYGDAAYSSGNNHHNDWLLMVNNQSNYTTSFYQYLNRVIVDQYNGTELEITDTTNTDETEGCIGWNYWIPKTADDTLNLEGVPAGTELHLAGNYHSVTITVSEECDLRVWLPETGEGEVEVTSDQDTDVQVVFQDFDDDGLESKKTFTESVEAGSSVEIVKNVGDSDYAASGDLNQSISWKLDKDGVLTISGNGPMPDYVEPEWLDYRDNIYKIVIGDGITGVGNDAFTDCKSCRSVSIPESVKNIGKSAFSGCTTLEELDWMKAPKIASIRDEAFLDCDSLVSVVIPEGVITLGDYAFARCDRLKSVIIPDTVTSSGDYIFAENGSLENVQMGTRMRWNIRVGVDSVEQHYPEGLFSNCPSLKTVTIPEGHREIGTCEYENCQNLQSITLPKTLKKIKDNAFKNCRNLTTVIFNGTKEEWKALTIGSGNDYLKRLRVECSDGPLMLVTSLSASLPGSTYTYTGKAITPEATLKNGSTMLKKGTDYAVSYTNNKNVGKATVTITGKGTYWGTVKKTFTIRPKGTGINYLTTGDKRFTVRWNKQATQTTGYQIQCCKNKTFASGTKLVTVAGTSNLSKTVTVAKAGAVYYVRVRTYKKTGTGALYYSAWSAVKSVKTNAAGPKGTTIVSLTPGSKRFTVKWNKQATKTTGYQIQYCKDKTFKTGAKLLTVAGASKLSKTVTVAKSGAVYYVRIRTYQKSGTGATYYSGWSAVRSVKTK